jgi:hypothetical protein
MGRKGSDQGRKEERRTGTHVGAPKSLLENVDGVFLSGNLAEVLGTAVIREERREGGGEISWFRFVRSRRVRTYYFSTQGALAVCGLRGLSASSEGEKWEGENKTDRDR